VKTLLNFGWIDGNRSLNRSRILKFENFPALDPDPVSSKISDLRNFWVHAIWASL